MHFKKIKKIYKGLECCANIEDDAVACEDCPYRESSDCVGNLLSDAGELLAELSPVGDGR